jgi:hypothetical protein
MIPVSAEIHALAKEKHWEYKFTLKELFEKALIEYISRREEGK